MRDIESRETGRHTEPRVDQSKLFKVRYGEVPTFARFCRHAVHALAVIEAEILRRRRLTLSSCRGAGRSMELADMATGMGADPALAARQSDGCDAGGKQGNDYCRIVEAKDVDPDQRFD